MNKTRKWSWLLFGLYLVTLVWIILFKFSLSIEDIVAQVNNQAGSLNLIPFKGSTIVNGQIDVSEILNNVLIFIPFGGLLGIVSQKASFIKKVFVILFFSLLIESAQFVFGLGASDITDVLTNVSGGIIGLLVYDFFELIIPKKKLDKFLTFIGFLALIAGVGFLVFLFIQN